MNGKMSSGKVYLMLKLQFWAGKDSKVQLWKVLSNNKQCVLVQ